jgi:hypothetical protein
MDSNRRFSDFLFGGRGRDLNVKMNFEYFELYMVNTRRLVSCSHCDNIVVIHKRRNQCGSEDF